MKKQVLITCSSLWLGACASMGSNEPDPVQIRLAALEMQNQSLQEEIANQQRMLNGLGAVGLGGSVAALEEQLRAIRGELDELGYSVAQQQDRQRALYQDLDERLLKLEGSKASSLKRPAVTSQTDTNADQKAYLKAFQQLKSREYLEAVKGFDTMLKQHPKSPYAPNAQYWIGEAHYVQREFDAAWAAFAQVLQRYPASPKAPDALLKQGLIRVEQEKTAEAKELLQRVITRFPDSAAAELAQTRLEQLGDA